MWISNCNKTCVLAILIPYFSYWEKLKKYSTALLSNKLLQNCASMRIKKNYKHLPLTTDSQNSISFLWIYSKQAEESRLESNGCPGLMSCVGLQYSLWKWWMKTDLVQYSFKWSLTAQANTPHACDDCWQAEKWRVLLLTRFHDGGHSWSR